MLQMAGMVIDNVGIHSKMVKWMVLIRQVLLTDVLASDSLHIGLHHLEIGNDVVLNILDNQPCLLELKLHICPPLSSCAVHLRRGEYAKALNLLQILVRVDPHDYLEMGLLCKDILECFLQLFGLLSLNLL